MKYCFKSGLIKQGFLHDLSKYGYTEFHNGAKYYIGTRSPHYQEREDKGYSEAWLHHKGRNKHHIEYWTDFSIKTMKYEPVDIPNRYLAESLCDRIAASEIYNGKKFEPHMVLDYYYHETKNLDMAQGTKDRLLYLINYYLKYGNEVFKFIKKNMRNKSTELDMTKEI